MNVPTFQIFEGSGDPETHAVWVEYVEGLREALDRMKVLAAEKPGPYFVSHIASKQVLASIDSRPGRTRGKP